MKKKLFFNTGFEYKSYIYDINKYGGIKISNNHHMWTSIDKIDIIEFLINQESFINFTDYPNNIEGTYKLYNYLEYDSIHDNLYILGCLIYHQLCYNENLVLNASDISEYE